MGHSAGDRSVTVDISQSGYDVIATASGTLDLTGLKRDYSYGYLQAVRGNSGYIGFGIPGTFVDALFGLTGPTSLGTGTDIFNASLWSGTPFGISVASGTTPFVLVAPDFLSGGAISASDTFAGTSIAALGLTPGQYVFSLPNDSVTINISDQVAPLPEPTTWAMMLAGFGMIGFAARRRQSVKTSVCFA